MHQRERALVHLKPAARGAAEYDISNRRGFRIKPARICAYANIIYSHFGFRGPAGAECVSEWIQHKTAQLPMWPLVLSELFTHSIFSMRIIFRYIAICVMQSAVRAFLLITHNIIYTACVLHVQFSILSMFMFCLSIL